MLLRAMAPKRSRVVGPLLLTAVLSGGCGGDSPGGVVVIGPVPDRVVVTPLTRTMLADETVQLSVSVLDEGGVEIVTAAIAWTSQDAAVATVSSTGLVAAVSAGVTLITATAQSGGGEASGSSVITVAPEVQAGSGEG